MVPALPHDRQRTLRIERLSLLSDGRLLYRLRHRWRNGTTDVVFEPLELVEKLAALVPPPRFNIIRYHGVLASAARWRRHVVPPGPLAVAQPTGIPIRAARRHQFLDHLLRDLAAFECIDPAAS